MSVISTSLSNIKTTEKEKLDQDFSKTIPSGWELVSGDIKNIKELLKDPKSTAELIFRRKSPLAAEAAAKEASKEQAKLGPEFQAIRISRVPEERIGLDYQLDNHNYKKIKTGFRPVALTIFDMTLKLQVMPGFPSIKFREYEGMFVSDEPTDLLPCPNDFWIQDYFESNGDRTGHSFLIGGLREYMKKVYFHLLVETDYFTQEEADYFYNLIDAKEASEEEAVMSKKIHDILASQNVAKYDECIQFAKALHAASLREAETNQRIKEQAFDPVAHKTINPIYFDEQETAYVLGLIFKKISPKHALQAFELLSKSSFLYGSSQNHIMNVKLYLSNIDTIQNNTKNDKEAVEIRSMRKDALLKMCPHDTDSINLFSHFMDLHCGFNSLSKDRLFVNLDCILPDDPWHTPGERMHSIVEPLFRIADYTHKIISPVKKTEETEKLSAVLNAFKGINSAAETAIATAAASVASISTIDTKISKEARNANAKNNADIPLGADISGSGIDNIATAAAKAAIIDNKKLVLGKPAAILAKEKIKNEIKATLPKSWQWISGDHEDLCSNEKSEEILVFKREDEAPQPNEQGYFEPENMPNPERPDNMFKVTMIKIARAKITPFPGAGENVVPSIKPLTIILYMANAKNDEVHKLYPISPSSNFPTKSSAAFLGNSFADDIGNFIETQIVQMAEANHVVHEHITMIQNKVELFPSYLVENWKMHLVKMGVWTEKEASYFINFIPKPKLSYQEQKLRDEVEQCLIKQDYDKAVSNAKVLHAISRERNQKNQFVWRSKLDKDNNLKPSVYLETEDYGYCLGERLYNLSPYYAYQSFNLITESSPLYPEAQYHMTKLALIIASNPGIDLANKDCGLEDIEDSRAYLKKAIIHHLYSLDSEDINPKLFIHLIFTLSGLPQTEESIFLKAGLFTEKFDDIWPFIVKVMLVLADKVYDFNVKTNITTKTNEQPMLLSQAATTAVNINTVKVISNHNEDHASLMSQAVHGSHVIAQDMKNPKDKDAPSAVAAASAQAAAGAGAGRFGYTL